MESNGLAISSSMRNLMLLGSLAGILALAAAYSSTYWMPLPDKAGGLLPGSLQRTFATAWAAMLLVTPAFYAFWFRRSSALAMRWWLAFWTIGYAVFLVHFVQATVIYFEGDWSKILHSKLVTLPRLDTVVTLWWGADVVLAWMGIAEGRLVRIQRIAVHVILLALFLLGSLKEGSYPASFIVGALLGIPALFAIYLKLRRSK